MKVCLTFLISTLLSIQLLAQQKDPVQWQYSYTKISEKVYELHFTARIEAPWHIYSQDNNPDITLPTRIDFVKSPIVDISKDASEKGSIITETISGSLIKFYQNSVEFVYTAIIKAKAKVNVSGAIKYMACLNGRCLPPAERKFTLTISGE